MTETTFPTKSEVFSWYNRARVCDSLDVRRVNRALGLLIRKDQTWREKYQSTTRNCGCEDHRRNPSGTCKHMVAKMIETRINQNRPTTTTTATVENYSHPIKTLADGTVTTDEQVSGSSYRVHYFNSTTDAENWIKTTSHGTIVRQGQAHGKRLPDHDHR